MPQGLTDLGNMLQDLSEKPKVVLKYLQQFHHLCGNGGEKLCQNEVSQELGVWTMMILKFQGMDVHCSIVYNSQDMEAT